jgi:photosystem II stability/assembly factor-like uncharacterized protein
VTRTPLLQGNPSSGIFSIAVDSDNRVFVLGGDYQEAESSEHVAATSSDGGKTWQLALQQPRGFRSAVAHVDKDRWVAVGPTGEDLSSDNGIHWRHTDSLNLNAAVILDPWTGWAVGSHGTIARLVVHHPR